MNIIIPDDYQDVVRTLPCFQQLDGHAVTIYNDTVNDMDSLVQRFHMADMLVLTRERTRITAELLARLPNLKFIAQTGKGATHIDLEACTRQGVKVSVGTGSPHAPAELTWGLILASMRQIPSQIAAMKAGQWQTGLGVGLRGRILGIYGYGKIGALVAGFGRAFGMRVWVWGREGSIKRAKTDGFEIADSREAFFSQSDVLSLHVKLDSSTHGLIKAADLALMKPTALLVNTSRAELIESGALVEGLKVGRPGFAAVDVYESEPVKHHPLLDLPNALCTPHLGYVEYDSYELYFGTAFEQVIAFANGEPIGLLNP